MTANNSWQNQGRQQHGWFGNGATQRDIHPVEERKHPAQSEPPLGHVYPIEYLLGLFTTSVGRIALSAALRNLGWREPTPPHRPDPPPPQSSGQPEQTSPPNLEILQGRQNKHIPGTNDYIEGDQVIGVWKDLNGNSGPTTIGSIRYAKDGAHIVPERPMVK